MNGISPLDPSSTVGQVRLLISDIEPRTDPATPSVPAEYLFADDHISAFLTINLGNVWFAAADALTALGTNESLRSKKIRKENLQTDGPAVTNALRLLAQDYRARGNKVQEAGDAADGTFLIVDFEDPVTPFDTFEAMNGGPLWH